MLLKIGQSSTSLAIQWLRLCDSNAEDVDLILGQGTKIPHACHMVRPKKKKKKEQGSPDNTELSIRRNSTLKIKSGQLGLQTVSKSSSFNL